MAVIMLVTLYTSRVVLDVLGVNDYGIYNIVGGVVISLNFIQSALNSATLRFISFELGKKEEGNVVRVFSMSLNIQVIFLLVILILLETVGLWFLNSILSIPPDRIYAANIAYQFSILAFCANVIRVPYNAMLISYERMSVYAILSIIEAILRLAIVYFLLVINQDKLVVYSILVFIVTLLTNSLYLLYCRKLFANNCRYVFEKDTKLFKSMIGFSGWNLVGGLTGVATNEGPNYVINIYMGVALNAAMGIAKQVASAVYTFTESFQTAFRPQIVKYYASSEYEELNRLILNASKISFFLMFIIGFPIILNINEILDMWLVDVPDYSASFCSCILIGYFINAMSSPLWMLAHATGDIKKYQIAISVISLLIIPIALLILALQLEPYLILLMQAFLNCVIFAYRLYFAKTRCNFRVGEYCKSFMTDTALLIAVIIPIPIILRQIEVNWILVMFVSICISVVAFYFLGISKSQRVQLKQFVKARF